MSDAAKDPQGLLQAYLDDLLATAEPAPYAEPAEEQRARLQKLLYSAAPRTAPELTTSKSVQPEIAPPVIVEPVREAPAPKRPEAEPRVHVAEPLPTPDPEPPSAPMAAASGRQDVRLKDVEWLANGRPAWAQERFDVLLFKVSGLTLAVPLIALGQIQPLTDELTPLFGQAEWFMGLLPTPTGKIRTVNTARFVMPERYDERFVETAEYVISIDGVPWGLAVDSVNQPISLDPDDVKWRTERSRRPWLAGTVKEHMCALLDIPRIGQLLLDADRKRA